MKAASRAAVQSTLFAAQDNRPVLGGPFARRASGMFAGKGLGQVPMMRRGPKIGPAHHKLHARLHNPRARGLGQAVVDVNPSDYTNLGFDQTTATSMAQLDNNFNAGSLGATTSTAAQQAYITQAQANMATIAPTSTVDENAADYQALGWSAGAAQAAANAATDFNAGTTTAAQYASAMQAAVTLMFSGAAVQPSAAQTASGATPASGLTPAQQAAVDQAAITSAASVLNTGIAGVVAATKGQQLSTNASGGLQRTPAASAAGALTTNQKIGLGVAGVVVVGGIVWWAMSGTPRRRRRR